MVDNVINGDFETGALAPWQTDDYGEGYDSNVFVSDFDPYQGTYHAIIENKRFWGYNIFHQNIDFTDVKTVYYARNIIPDPETEAAATLEVLVDSTLLSSESSWTTTGYALQNIDVSEISGYHDLNFKTYCPDWGLVLFLDAVSAIPETTIPRFSPLWSMWIGGCD